MLERKKTIRKLPKQYTKIFLDKIMHSLPVDRLSMFIYVRLVSQLDVLFAFVVMSVIQHMCCIKIFFACSLLFVFVRSICFTFESHATETNSFNKSDFAISIIQSDEYSDIFKLTSLLSFIRFLFATINICFMNCSEF